MSNLKPTAKQQAHAQSYLHLTGEARIRGLIGAFAEDVKSPDEMVFYFYIPLLLGSQTATDSLSQEWTKHLFPYLAVHSVSTPDAVHPSVTFSFTVQPAHCNRLGNLRMYSFSE
jgi:hypothetical protein